MKQSHFGSKLMQTDFALQLDGAVPSQKDDEDVLRPLEFYSAN